MASLALIAFIPIVPQQPHNAAQAIGMLIGYGIGIIWMVWLWLRAK